MKKIYAVLFLLSVLTLWGKPIIGVVRIMEGSPFKSEKNSYFADVVAVELTSQDDFKIIHWPDTKYFLENNDSLRLDKCEQKICLKEISQGMKLDYLLLVQIEYENFSDQVGYYVYSAEEDNVVYSFVEALDGKWIRKEVRDVLTFLRFQNRPQAKTKTMDSSGLFTDNRDGKRYKYVKIGDHFVMAENLNYKTDTSLCYDNAPENCRRYGRLYNMKEASTVCPEGWHLPAEWEWKVVKHQVRSGLKSRRLIKNSTMGHPLKATSGWPFGANGKDDFGFAALPGGAKVRSSKDKGFRDLGKAGSWWSSPSLERSNNLTWGLWEDDVAFTPRPGSKYEMHSIRCFRDWR